MTAWQFPQLGGHCIGGRTSRQSQLRHCWQSPLAISAMGQRSTMKFSRRLALRSMNDLRWHWLPIGLVTAGVTAVAVAGVVNARALGWWDALVFAGCAAA